ncbi:MAG: CHASE2 domain-containing protein [Armatimonadetes bacterium]|nr:CHASE2 domain-containing protein [Armatimonadota bacterium]
MVLLVLVGLALGFAAKVVSDSGPMRRLEDRAYDRRIRFWRQMVEADTQKLAIVAIDNDSLESLRLHWPLPRHAYARIIDSLRKADASAIGVAVLFEAPASDDGLLQSAVSGGKDVVLASRINGTALVPPAIRGPSGFTNIPADSDGVVRSFFLWPAGFKEAPQNLALQLLRVYYQDDEFLPRGFGGSPGTTYPIAFAGPPETTFQTISVKRILAGGDLKRDVAGKIVLVGSTLGGVDHPRATPFSRKQRDGGWGPTMSSVEVMANVVYTMMREDESSSMTNALEPISPFENWCLIVGIVFICFQMFARMPSPAALVLTLGFMLLYGMGVCWAILQHHRLLPVVGPLLGFAVAFAAATLYRLTASGTALVRRIARRQGRTPFE